MTDLALDADVPDGAAVVALLLHPHPDMGGNRYNQVIGELHRRLPAAGAASIRFDFTSADLDVALAEAGAALEVAAERAPGAVVVAVGYSFGAMVAARLADERVAGWFLVAPPIDHLDASIVADDARPKVLAVPDHDFSPPEHVAAVTAAWRSTELVVVPGADHFLAGATGPVADHVVGWLRAHGWLPG